MNFQDLWAGSLPTKIISSVVLILAVLVARLYIASWIRAREKLQPTVKRQWIVRTRNVTFFLVFGILVVVWLEQLRTIAASIVVIAAAIVVATKEFLLNVVGFAYRSTAKFISVGDRIEVGGVRGDVIDQNLMGITLLEIGPSDKTHQYTGLTTFLPNSLFLSSVVKNETFIWSDYVFHLMTIPVKAQPDQWQKAEKALLQAAEELSAPYLDKARRAMTTKALQQSLNEPSIDPRVQVQITDPETYSLVLRLPVPTRKRAHLEQEIVRRYLQLIQKPTPVPGKPVSPGG